VATELKLPDLGEGVEGGDIVQVRVSPGDMVQAEQTVVEIETDKAVLEVPCNVAGRVVDVLVKTGDKVKVGATLLTVDTDGKGESPAVGAAPVAAAASQAEPSPAAAKEPEKKAEARKPEKPPAQPKPSAKKAEPAAAAAEESDEPVPAGPATRRLARELGVDLRDVAAGRAGKRITEDDVKAFVRQRQERGAGEAHGGFAGVAVTLPDFTQWGEVERVPFSSLQRKTAEHLWTGWAVAPHVTQFEMADITRLEALRRRFRETEQGKAVKLTVTAFVLKALVAALKEYPQFNASLDTQASDLVLKRYYHIGVAVDTEAGLIVPVIRDVDAKSVLSLAAEMNELAERTRKRKVGLDELRGGTFTVTNLGGIGGTAFTPIINYPEVAILGLARSRQEPGLVNGQLANRLMLPLCLSYDHRVINGADGARFVRKLAGLLEDPEVLLLGL